jgi:hypothetical protein
MVPFGTRVVLTSETFIPNALRHPAILVSYEIGSGISLWDRQPADALFPVAAKMTFRAPVRTAAVPPWRLLFRLRTAAHRLRDFAEFGSPRKLPLRVTCTTLAGRTNRDNKSIIAQWQMLAI